MPSRTTRATVFGLLALTCVARVARAQPFTLDEKIKPTELQLQPYHGGGRTDGRLYGAEITQTEPTKYVFVQGLSIYSPDYVGITGREGSNAIQIGLYKETWDRANRAGATDASGHWETKFRTSGDFGIRITPAHLPATYTLVVWVGNEVDARLPAPFTRTASTTAAAAANTTLPAASVPDAVAASADHAVVYAAAAVVIVAILAFTFYKVRTARPCIVIATLLLAPPLTRPIRAQDYPKAVGEMLEQLKSFLERQESVENFWKALQSLSGDESLPDETQRGPSVPSSCIDNSWRMPAMSEGARDCRCMTEAVDKLRRNRRTLEKMRILVANQKNFVDKAIALGNSYAQLHTALGLQWIGIRKHDIEEPYDQFKLISKQKHEALMAAVKKDLMDISACEAKLGDPGWYDKFGFVYYEFLYAAYKPSF